MLNKFYMKNYIFNDLSESGFLLHAPLSFRRLSDGWSEYGVNI